MDNWGFSVVGGGGLKWLQLEADYLPEYGVRLRMRGGVLPLSYKLSCFDSFHLLPEIRFLGNVTGTDRLEQVGVDWRIILKRIFKIGWGGLDLSGSGRGQVVGSCGNGNEPSGSMK
jgi:hypothetical protein